MCNLDIKSHMYTFYIHVCYEFQLHEEIKQPIKSRGIWDLILKYMKRLNSQLEQRNLRFDISTWYNTYKWYWLFMTMQSHIKKLIFLFQA